MKRATRLVWILCGLFSTGLSLIFVAVAIHLALMPHWPAAYPGSLNSHLLADYSPDPENLPRLPPVGVGLIEELVQGEGEDAAPGPLATLIAPPSVASSATPGPSRTPSPSRTSKPSPTPTLTPLRRPRSTPTPTPQPTRTATAVPTPVSTLVPTASRPTPTSPPPLPTQVSPLPTSTPMISPLETPQP